MGKLVAVRRTTDGALCLRRAGRRAAGVCGRGIYHRISRIGWRRRYRLIPRAGIVIVCVCRLGGDRGSGGLCVIIDGLGFENCTVGPLKGYRIGVDLPRRVIRGIEARLQRGGTARRRCGGSPAFERIARFGSGLGGRIRL